MLSEQATLRQRAERLAVEQRWDDEARRINAHLIELDPRDIAAHTRLARCCRLQGDAQSAVVLYRRVLTLAPNNRIAQNGLAALEGEQRVQHTASEIRTYKEAFSRGVAARGRHDSPLAVALLTRAIELKRTRAARIALAGAHRDLQQLDQAEALCKEVLAEEPADSGARVTLAAVYRDRGALKSAESLALHVLESEPGNVHAMRVLSGIYSDLGMANKAEEWYRRSQGVIESQESRAPR